MTKRGWVGVAGGTVLAASALACLWVYLRVQHACATRELAVTERTP